MADTTKARQNAHYWLTKGARTWRNLGPAGGFQRMRTLYFVVHDLPLRAGTIVNGQPMPEGACLQNWPLCPALHSRRQCTRAFRKLQKRHPDARRMWLQAVIGPDMLRSPETLVIPEART